MGFFTRLLRPRKQQTHITVNLPTGVMTLYVEINCDRRAKAVVSPDMYFYIYSETKDRRLRHMNEQALKAHGLSGFKLKPRQYIQNCVYAIDFNIRGYNVSASKDIELFLES